MHYSSTRGGVQGYTFEQALLSGFTSDGGILLPETIPCVDKVTLQQWSSLSYPELVKKIVPYFVSEEEIPRNDLNALLDRAFEKFTLPEVVQVTHLNGSLNVLELYHGPTLAFKDLALSCVAHFLEYFLSRSQRHVTVVVGTSGDTGSAALESVRGLKWLDLIVLLPRGWCTAIQELQMTTMIADNLHVYRVAGSSDDLDAPIKACFLDSEFATRHNLISVNSINWARILVQIAHYFYACLHMSPDLSKTVEVVVPTGACGNVTSGVIAQKMGLPIKLVCTVNSNDIVARTLKNGDYSTSDATVQTLAPAMDIQVPYNMERLFHLFTDGDVDLVNSIMIDLEGMGIAIIPNDLQNKISDAISTYVVDDAGIKSAMSRCWQENTYLVCPHTATALHYHYNNSISLPRVCVATASPAKFEEAVVAADLQPQPTESILNLKNLPTKFKDMEKQHDWEAILRKCIEDITTRVEASQKN